jgi:DNA-binding transcriptional regulator GbsR (MarR family)
MSESGSDDGDDVSEGVAKARERVIEALERSADVYGFNRSYGRLYGILYFADEPVSLDELVERSGYAKSTVSSAMKDMERVHMVYRRSIVGEGKKAFYEAERDFWVIVQEMLRGEFQREVTLMTRALADAGEMLEDVDGEQAERDLEKVRQLQRMYRWGQQLIDLLSSTSMERLMALVDQFRRD